MPQLASPNKNHKKAVSQPIYMIVAELQPLLGQKLIAYATGISTPKLVGRWAIEGGPNPRDESATRPRDLYRVVLILSDQFGEETIRAFLMGSHPDLQDRTPLDVIHDGQGVEAIHAAAAFLD